MARRRSIAVLDHASRSLRDEGSIVAKAVVRGRVMVRAATTKLAATTETAMVAMTEHQGTAVKAAAKAAEAAEAVEAAAIEVQAVWRGYADRKQELQLARERAKAATANQAHAPGRDSLRHLASAGSGLVGDVKRSLRHSSSTGSSLVADCRQVASAEEPRWQPPPDVLLPPSPNAERPRS